LPHWQVIAELETALQEKNWLTAVYIQQKFHEQITQTLQHNREEIKLLLQALRARTGSKQERIFNEINFKTILKTLPIWLVNLSDIYEVLPLEKELFDIIIIDESSQCDIASCLPVLYRAKRVLFSGDPKQLRHISFLSQLKQHLLQKKYNLPEHSELFDYREKSILDIVSTHVKSQNQVIFLDEHYRSHPSIIGFSNQHFYNNTLRIMTRKTHKSDNQHIELIPCDGKRTKHGYNMEEAEQIVQRISKIIETERELDNSSCRSIGILSPFRDQADYISSLLFKYLTLADIKKHQIAVGTAYNFQGEERDIMLLSLALDAKSHPSAFYHVNKPDVFNVSITRAKSFQQIFLSIEPAQLKQDSLLRNYLENIQTNRYGPQITNQQSIEHEVKLVLESLNLEVWQDFPVAGQVIDLVVHYHHHIYGIDLIGFPGRWAESYSLDTYKMAARAGLKIFPLPYTYWLMNQSTCVQALRQFMNIENSKK
jgi:superfamily I DNA and/or RNA helicase